MSASLLPIPAGGYAGLPTRMRISVITPVHDGGDAFRACLAALAACAPPAHELIVVVDGGSDGAAALLQRPPGRR